MKERTDLVQKPESCRPCGMYQGGGLFTPDRIVPRSTVMVCGQNPGELEEQGKRIVSYDGPGRYVTEPCEPQPFTGPTGWAMNSFLPMAGLERDDVSMMNSLRCRWHDKNELPPEKILAEALKHCRQYDTIPASTKLIVATGGPAMRAMTGSADPVGDWRGYLLPYQPLGLLEAPRAPTSDIWTPAPVQVPVLVTYHVAFVQENPSLRPVAMKDWSKVKQVLTGTWPKPLPMMMGTPPPRWPLKCSFDTEFNGDFLLRYSMAWNSQSGPLVHVVEREDSFTRPQVTPGSTVIMQNAEVDMDFMDKVLGRSCNVNIDDTMYAHAVLHSDLDHDLNFGGSIYSSLNRWKHLNVTNPRVYSAGDAIATLDWWTAMEQEFKRDPRSEWVYRNCLLPQLHIIRAARRKGIRVNHQRIGPACKELEATMRVAELQAQASAGYPLNIDSPQQVARWLYDVEHVK